MQAGSGSLSLTKNGSGVLTLVGANTGSYSGGLTVNAGTLDYSGGVLPTGRFPLRRHLEHRIAFAIDHFAPGHRRNHFGSGTLSCPSAAIQAGTVNATLAGAGGLTKSTSGAAVVNNPAYSGNTMVQGGSLTFTGSLPTGNLLVSGGAFNIGSLSKLIRSFNITGGTITGNGAISVINSDFSVQGGQVDVVLAGVPAR